MPAVRLQKILARAGVASRRAAEEMIRSGRVTVNGAVATAMGTCADPGADAIRVDGRRLRAQPPARVVALHKPRGVVTTMADPEGRRTVADLIPAGAGRLVPIGRLDFHSEGLLLLTNDGDLAHAVLHPSSAVTKAYHVKVRGSPSEAALRRFARGIRLEGRRTRPARVRRLRGTRQGNCWLEVELHEGRRNQIRRMCDRLGHPVQRLRRVRIGPIDLGDLRPGENRELTLAEVGRLRRAARPAGLRPEKGPGAGS